MGKLSLLVSIFMLSSCKSNKNDFNDEPAEEVTIDNGQLEIVINKIKEATLQPSISLKAERKPTSVFNSKLGGIPYLPHDFIYPYNKSDLAINDR